VSESITLEAVAFEATPAEQVPLVAQRPEIGEAVPAVGQHHAAFTGSAQNDMPDVCPR
jgi:hypothetical protein